MTKNSKPPSNPVKKRTPRRIRWHLNTWTTSEDTPEDSRHNIMRVDGKTNPYVVDLRCSVPLAKRLVAGLNAQERAKGKPKDLLAAIVANFPGFLKDEEVNGADLVDFLAERVATRYKQRK